jgi:hypothetical protein
MQIQDLGFVTCSEYVPGRLEHSVLPAVISCRAV